MVMHNANIYIYIYIFLPRASGGCKYVNALLRYVKAGISPSTFLQPVNGSKNSILN